MAIKAVNDLAGPDGIIPTLIFFNIYPKLIKKNPLFLSITKKTEIMLWKPAKF